VGLWLIFVGLGREVKIEPEKPVGALLLFVFGLALLHMAAGGDDPADWPPRGGEAATSGIA